MGSKPTLPVTGINDRIAEPSNHRSPLVSLCRGKVRRRNLLSNADARNRLAREEIGQGGEVTFIGGIALPGDVVGAFQHHQFGIGDAGGKFARLGERMHRIVTRMQEQGGAGDAWQQIEA